MCVCIDSKSNHVLIVLSVIKQTAMFAYSVSVHFALKASRC